MVNPRSHLIRDYLHRYSKYSFNFNLLTQHRLVLTCLSNSYFPGDVLLMKEGLTQIKIYQIIGVSDGKDLYMD